MNNSIKILDFSMGERDYKKRWCDTEYYYERHIIYDSKSLKATMSAKTLKGVHNFKQFLRVIKINLIIHRIINIFQR